MYAKLTGGRGKTMTMIRFSQLQLLLVIKQKTNKKTTATKKNKSKNVLSNRIEIEYIRIIT